MSRSFAVAGVLCLFAVLGLSGGPAGAQQGCQSVVRVWPLGPSYRVALDGDLALVARGRELALVDVSNPNSPPLPVLGRVVLPGQPFSIARSAAVPGLAAVALNEEGVALVDYSNPAAPVVTQHFAVDGRAAAVAFGLTEDVLFTPAERLFVARGSRGLQIVEYDAPGGAILRGTYELGFPLQSDSVDIAVERFDAGLGFGTYRAYVADGGAGVTVLDVKSSDFPFLVAGPVALSGSAPARGLLLHRDPALPAGQTDRLYVAAGTGGLRALTLAFTLPDQQVSWVPASGVYDFRGLARVGTRLFVAAVYGQGRVLDVADLGAISQLAATGFTPGRVHAVAAKPSGHALFAGEQAGLLVYQFQAGPPATFPFRSSLGASGSTYDAAGTDRYAYLADFDFGLQIVDLLAPGGPARVSPPGAFFFQGVSVALAGPLALVGDFFGNLRVIDVANPAAPFEAGLVTVTTAPGGYLGAIAVDGTRAFVTASNAQLLAAVDFSNPAAPVVLDDVALGASAGGVALHGQHAYVTLQGSTDLAVVDISQPANLVLLPPAPAGGVASDVALGGGVGLLARGGELVTLGLASPAAPAPLGSVVLPGPSPSAVQVAPSPGRAHLAGWVFDPLVGTPVGRAFAVDVANPAAPVALGATRLPSPITIAPAGDRLITANRDLGAAVLSNCTIFLRDGFEDGVPLPGRWSARWGP